MDKHDERHNGTHPAAAGDQPDPARSHTPADHRPGQAQAHPEQESAEGQGNPGMGDRIGIADSSDYGPACDYLHTASRTHLKGKAPV